MKLSTKGRIKEILDSGERRYAGPLRSYRLPAKPNKPGNLSILIAKKRYPKSVDRNRLRRLVREAWRKDFGSQPWDCLISVGHVNLSNVGTGDMHKWLKQLNLS